MSLAAFFDTMLPFLLGDLPPGAVEAAIGPSPSGTARLAFYQELTRRERVAVLQKLYPATAAAAARVRSGLFTELVNAHLSRHRSTHWEPNRFGEPFPALVAERCEYAPVLGELADYEWLKFSVGVEPGSPVHFRSYEHDVVRFARAVANGATIDLPGRSTIAVAVHRSPAGRATATTLGAADLAALARRRGLSSALGAMPAAEVDAAEERLIRRGVLCAQGA